MTYYMGPIVFVPSSELDSALNVYEEIGDTRSRRIFKLLHPQGYIISNQRAFYDAAAATFPLNPPLSEELLAKFKMAALMDSLHGGIRGVEEQIIDIIWPNIDLVVQESIPTLVLSLDLLEHVLFGFRDAHYDRRVNTRILLVYKDGQPGFTDFWDDSN